jgi:hypothetical protein
MSANQLEIIVNQVRTLPPDDLVKLIKKLVELLEQKQTSISRQKVDYLALIGSGKGAFATPEEANQFLREERNAWER